MVKVRDRYEFRCTEHTPVPPKAHPAGRCRMSRIDGPFTFSTETPQPVAFTVPLSVMGALLDRLGGAVEITWEERGSSTVQNIHYEDNGDGKVRLTAVHEEKKPVSGSVYVHISSDPSAPSVRQRTIETPNTTVVFDYDAQDQLIGVEVLDAHQVDWNGRTMPLPGSTDG